MTSTDQSDQKRYQPRAGATSPPASLLGDGGRVLLLAVGGYFIVRMALALLHLT
jgi:hypothetical protein